MAGPSDPRPVPPTGPGSPSAPEDYFRRILDHVPDAVVTTDPLGRVTFANPAAEALYGIPEEMALGRGLADLLSAFDAGQGIGLDEVTGVVAREGRWHGEIVQRTPDGRDLLVEASVSLLRQEDGAVLGSVSILREVSDRKAAERLISHQASHDGLTGLLNRVAFMAELRSRLASGRPVTLAFLDLNGFKAINDSHGHERGDEILVAVAGRMAGGIRAGDIAGRFGGDEFVLLALGLEEPDAIVGYVDRITALFAEPVRARGGTVHPVGVSMGIAHSRPDDTPDTLLRRADSAMYEAKRSTEVASAYRVAP